jgi:predicted molibdopterin-dependent oxidoreductase YjgC
VTIRVDGKAVEAFAGETVFAALTAAGIRAFRHPSTLPAEPARGGLCGMGVCQECRVTVDGAPDRRACMTEVRAGMEIGTDAP